jgi:hypothetical protein
MHQAQQRLQATVVCPANKLRSQGRWDAAEELQVRVMEACKKKLGADYPFTLTSMNNLTFTWKEQGCNKAAAELMSECVRLRTHKLGANHPFTLSSIDTLNGWRLENLVIDLASQSFVFLERFFSISNCNRAREVAILKATKGNTRFTKTKRLHYFREV